MRLPLSHSLRAFTPSVGRKAAEVTRLWAQIAEAQDESDRTRTVHYRGASPAVADILGFPAGEIMARAAVVIIEPEKGAGGSFFLIRFSSDGQEVGDTWHQSVEDAKHQAAFEFGDSLGDWNQSHAP